MFVKRMFRVSAVVAGTMIWGACTADGTLPEVDPVSVEGIGPLGDGPGWFGGGGRADTTSTVTVTGVEVSGSGGRTVTDSTVIR